MTIETFALSTIAIFTSALVFCFYLYHRAHGRDVDAVRSGGELVMDALRRDGRLMSSDVPDETPVAFNYVDDAEDEPSPYEAAIQRTQERAKKFADQQAEREIEDVMENMNKGEFK
jgi:hypothetical protein